jgi:hypothetical protein
MTLLDTPAAYTREMKLKAIEREIGYRKRVYARRVGEQKMTQKQADYEIGVFEAIAADYRPTTEAA